MKSQKDRVLQLARKAGVLRPRDLDAEGIPRVYLQRLLSEGLLVRPGRGIYVALIWSRRFVTAWRRRANACPMAWCVYCQPSNFTN